MNGTPAIEGGQPVRKHFLSMAAPTIDDAAIAAVTDVLRSGWLTSGPMVERFEQEFAEYAGSRYAVAVASGTDAIGLSLEVAGIGPGDEVITTPMTWVATAHQVLRRGAAPVFSDIDRSTFNMDMSLIENSVTGNTKALLPVHFAGRPCDMNQARAVAEKHDLTLISDSAHAIETRYDDGRIAPLADLNAYSFHPMKNITTGEGGMITTDNAAYYDHLKLLRFHGVDKSAAQRHDKKDTGDWDVTCLGTKSLMSEMQAAIGIQQLSKIETNHDKREELVSEYNRLFSDSKGVTTPPEVDSGSIHAWHMYNVLLDIDSLSVNRDQFCAALKQENIGAGIHYYSLHKTSYYREKYDLSDEDFPEASFVSDRILTLPLHPGMDRLDCETVVDAVTKLIRHYRRGA